MITPKIGKAMATTVTRHNCTRTQKLELFYKALKALKAIETSSWKSEIIFIGTLGGKHSEVFLLNNDGKVTLNLIVEGTTFQPLRITDVVNENDYLAWNLRVRKEMGDLQEAPQSPTQSEKIANPKAISKKAKSHNVTPLDHDTYRVKSDNSGNEYLVRLLPNEKGAICECKWGQTRKYMDNYKSGCSHVQAVYLQLEGQRGRTTSAWSSKEAAQRQHRQMTDLGDGVILTSRRTCKSPS